MWPSRGDDRETVTCIACDASVARPDAREYDKYGDRWDREGKTFEYLCKPCHAALSHHPRIELESLLVEIDAGNRDQREFIARYVAAVEDRYDRVEER